MGDRQEPDGRDPLGRLGRVLKTATRTENRKRTEDDIKILHGDIGAGGINIRKRVIWEQLDSISTSIPDRDPAIP